MALKPLNSVAGFSVGETPANIILANGDVTTNNITTTGKANLNAIGNVVVSGGSAGQVIQTDGLGNLSFVTINTSQLANGNSNVQVLANGNITFSSAGTANVGVITSTGMNVAGYISGGNITANGNVSVNNYIVTPANVDLIVAPDTQITRFYSNANPFSGGYSLGNNLARWDNVYANTANIVGNVSAGNVLTNNLLYANGQPWDLQEAAGANKEIQYNDGSNNFGASANFTFDYATNLLTVNGNAQFNNANLGNLAIANFVNVSSNLTVSLQLDGNTANFTGTITTLNANLGNLVTANFANFTNNIVVQGDIANANNVSVTANLSAGNVKTDNLLYANGQPWDLQEAAGANTEIQYNDGNDNFGASNAFTFDYAGNLLTVVGNAQFNNANLGNLATANFANFANDVVVQGNIANANNITVTNNITSNTANVTGNISAGNVITLGNVDGGNLSITTTGTIPNIIGANISTSSNANLTIEPNGTGVVVIANTAGGATAIAMGDPTQGNLISNAVTLSNSSSVSNAIAQLNVVLGKLVPPAPPNFPASQTISIQTLSSYRMANYVQTDNTPGANKSVAGGTTVTTVRRASSYSTGNITTAGPGDSGTITAQLNGANAGGRTLTAALDGNGTYSNLVIFNNFDYNSANANIAAGFWSVFSSRVAGTITEGWTEVFIADSATSNSNTANWFYDSSAPGTPTFSTLGITAPGSPSYAYSSTVPHYDNTNIFTVTFDVNKLSGNMYPTSDTFVTGTSGGAFGTPVSVTYATASITTPLAQNLYVSSGNASISTTSTIISGFGASSTGPSVSVVNSYNTGTQSFTSTLAANALYKTGTTSSATRIEEANVFVGSTIGSGSGLAFRIESPGSGNTPVFTGTEADFNSQTSTLQTYDSTVVANILKHDQTNYSTGYLPVGPNLSAGRSSTQYLTLKIIRTSVSKFDIKWSGTIAGLWVALPGSTIDSTSSANGWLSMSTAYAGAGIPGVNAPGNGSDGCALGGIAPLNSVQTNKSVTATFGTVSSSSTATNEIYIRIALTSGQSVTALSLQTASN